MFFSRLGHDGEKLKNKRFARRPTFRVSPQEKLSTGHIQESKAPKSPRGKEATGVPKLGSGYASQLRAGPL
nr:hypothetical protein BgiMline_008651 [Biomphalaria glabrata]